MEAKGSLKLELVAYCITTERSIDPSHQYPQPLFGHILSMGAFLIGCCSSMERSTEFQLSSTIRVTWRGAQARGKYWRDLQRGCGPGCLACRFPSSATMTQASDLPAVLPCRYLLQSGPIGLHDLSLESLLDRTMWAFYHRAFDKIRLAVVLG